MHVTQSVRWFPAYWVLSAIDQLISILTFTVGAIAGALLFAMVFPLPPQSGTLGLLFITLVVGLGFYMQSRLSRKWSTFFSRVTERMERDIRG